MCFYIFKLCFKSFFNSNGYCNGSANHGVVTQAVLAKGIFIVFLLLKYDNFRQFSNNLKVC